MVHHLINKPSFFDQVLSKALDGPLINLKLTRDRPAERNAVDTIEQRYDYARWLMDPNVVNQNKFFIDESGINFHTMRNRRRSKKRLSLPQSMWSTRTTHITVCIAVSNREQGLVHYHVFAGGMTAERFTMFWEVLCGNEFLADMNASGICIYDNARPQIRTSDLGAPGNSTFRRLLNYCPYLNMAKNAISCWKSRKDEFISPTGEILNSRTLQQFRFDTLNDIISSTAGEATVSKCQSWYNHTTTYLPTCIGREEIDG